MVLLIINVTIPSGYEYIRGTVNNEDTVFVVDPFITGLCLCNCEPAQDGTYEVSLTFYDEADQELSTVTRTVTQSNITFIYDRTAEDIQYLKQLTPTQRARLARDHKGALNTSDLQRLADAFGALEILDNTEFTIEVIPEFPSNALFQSYLDNAEVVKGTDYQLEGSPEVPALPLNDFDKWNKLERILFDNFDIRTTRFEYYGLLMRETFGLYPIVIVYQKRPYQTDLINLFNYPVTDLGGLSVLANMDQIQYMLNYQPEEEEPVNER